MCIAKGTVIHLKQFQKLKPKTGLKINISTLKCTLSDNLNPKHRVKMDY